MTKNLREGILPLVARLLISVIFFTSSIAKMFGWSSNIAFIESKHLPFAGILLAGALFIELTGWICLGAGFYSQPAASILFVYMIPVTFIFHSFMSTQFQKNLGIMGGLLMLATGGPGRYALDLKKMIHSSQ